MTDIVELLPCPFCGHKVNAISDNERGLMFNVHCGNGGCRAAGPWERCAADAAVAWNTRAAYEVMARSNQAISGNGENVRSDPTNPPDREITLKALHELDRHWRNRAPAVREGRISIYADAIAIINDLGSSGHEG